MQKSSPLNSKTRFNENYRRPRRHVCDIIVNLPFYHTTSRCNWQCHSVLYDHEAILITAAVRSHLSTVISASHKNCSNH